MPNHDLVACPACGGQWKRWDCTYCERGKVPAADLPYFDALEREHLAREHAEQERYLRTFT